MSEGDWRGNKDMTRRDRVMRKTKRTVKRQRRARACNPSVSVTEGNVSLCQCRKEESRSHSVFFLIEIGIIGSEKA